MGKQSREKRERRWQEKPKEVPDFRSGLEKVYFSVIEWGIYLILFTPLVFIKSYFFPFVVPKTIFFRIVVDIVLIAYTLLIISNRKYLPKFSPLTIAITVFLGVLVLASLTGINFARSFWSTFERMTGLLTFFHLYAFFIILTSVFRERKYWERILSVSIFAGTIICFDLFLSGEALVGRGGTLGNTSFLSAYLIFNIFFAIILFLVKGKFWKIFTGLALIVMMATLFFNKEPTQGAIGAFWGGIFILAFGCLLFYSLHSRKQVIKRLVLILIALVIFGGIGIFFVRGKLMGIWQSNSLQSRLIVWEMGWKGWQERFWLGWGPENFNAPFAKYFNPTLPLTGDLWYDRAHNIILDVAVESGALGLLSYFAIFGVAIWGLVRTGLKVVEKKNVFFPLGMTCLLLVYCAQNIWVFDMVSSYMIFFLSLAFIDFLISPKGFQISNTERNPFSTISGALLIIISLLALYFGNIQSARASQYTVRGLASSLEEAIPNFQKAIEISPMSIFETPEQFAKKVDGYTFDEKQNKEILKNGFELSTEELKKSIERNLQDYRLYLVLGRHYNDFFLVTQDAEKLKQAEESLNRAIELSPENQQTYWSLAQTRVSQGRMDEAINLMKKTVDLEPRYALSHWYLSMAYKIAGENELALEKVKDAEKAGFDWRSSSENLKKVIEIYQQLQNDNELIALYPLAIKMDPNNAQLKAAFAVAYANLGEFDKAREMINEALKLNPSFADQLKEFLDGLPE